MWFNQDFISELFSESVSFSQHFLFGGWTFMWRKHQHPPATVTAPLWGDSSTRSTSGNVSPNSDNWTKKKYNSNSHKRKFQMHSKSTSFFQNLSKRHHKGSMKTASRHQKALPWKCRLHACLAVPVWSQKPPQVHNAKHTQHKIFIQWIGNLKHALQFFLLDFGASSNRERKPSLRPWVRVMTSDAAFFTYFCDLLKVLSLCQPFLTLWVLLLSLLSMTLASRLTVVNCLRKARKGRLTECVKDCVYRNKGERMSIRKSRCGKAQTWTGSYSKWSNNQH